MAGEDRHGSDRWRTECPDRNDGRTWRPWARAAAPVSSAAMDEVRRRRALHGPADDAPGREVQDHCEIAPSVLKPARRHAPAAHTRFKRRGRKRRRSRLGRNREMVATVGGDDEAASPSGAQTGGAHEPGDALAAHGDSPTAERTTQSRSTCTSADCRRGPAAAARSTAHLLGCARTGRGRPRKNLVLDTRKQRQSIPTG